ncbi:hypothetical protein AB0M05_41470 [Streptomyces violaceusniger]|uniref:hypothetical protein n=1 Tax=Streptomyces violaceusniger TaxID=68280 RepID=UPI0034179594
MNVIKARFVAARNSAARIATVTGSAALAAGLTTSDYTAPTVLATIGATATGMVAATAFSSAPDPVKGPATILYATPGVSLLGVLAAERLVPGMHWGEIVAVAVWSAGVWWLRPARAALRLLGRDHQAPTITLAATTPEGPLYPLAQWWAQHVGIDGGIAPGTRLVNPQQLSPKCVTAIIAAPVGCPVPTISKTHLSARADIPEELIHIDPIPGRGASFKQLVLGTPPTDPQQEWIKRVGSVLPGTRLLKIRTPETERKKVTK